MKLLSVPIKIIGILSLCLLSQGVFSQNQSMKFGKISEEELKNTTCPLDSSAGAMIIGDYGTSTFSYDQSKERFQVNFERHVRIKILNKNGYDEANEGIPYYHENSLREEVYNLKGFTYNLEGGKIIKTKLEKEGIFEESINDNWTLKRVTMPNVKEGSVIELSYTIKSYFLYNLREWEFQKNIPVLWSEYSVQIPEYFDYKLASQGYESFVLNERKQGNGYIIFHAKSRSEGNVTQSNYSSQKIDYKTTNYKWATQNVPAIKEEPFMTTIDDYVTKIEFELASVQMPHSIRKDFSRNWESITAELLKHENFGLLPEKNSFIKKEVQRITSSLSSPDEKILVIHNYVKKMMKWNGSNRLFGSQSLKKSFDDKTGNSADINFLLIAMLREAGISADPLILSTRDHGRANMLWPTLNKFNYVVAYVSVDDKSIVLDATDIFLPPNFLPYKCLNGQGRIISKDISKTIDLGSHEKMAQMFSATVDVEPSGLLLGKVQNTKGGIRAFEKRKSITSTGLEKYIEEYNANFEDWDIENLKVSNLESIDENLWEEFDFKSKDYTSSTSGIIYLNPLMNVGIAENPFKLAERKFPVDFACPIDESIIIKINLPEGYKIDEIPENALITLPDNTGKFYFTIAQLGNTLQVTSRISINSRYFMAENYFYLREFYNQIVKKHSQQIVLKKI